MPKKPAISRGLGGSGLRVPNQRLPSEGRSAPIPSFVSVGQFGGSVWPGDRRPNLRDASSRPEPANLGQTKSEVRISPSPAGSPIPDRFGLAHHSQLRPVSRLLRPPAGSPISDRFGLPSGAQPRPVSPLLRPPPLRPLEQSLLATASPSSILVRRISHSEQDREGDGGEQQLADDGSAEGPFRDFG